MTRNYRAQQNAPRAESISVIIFFCVANDIVHIDLPSKGKAQFKRCYPKELFGHAQVNCYKVFLLVRKHLLIRGANNELLRSEPFYLLLTLCFVLIGP